MDDEMENEFGKQYMQDFKKLNRKDGAIITDGKFAEFMKKHIPGAFASQEIEGTVVYVNSASSDFLDSFLEEEEKNEKCASCSHEKQSHELVLFHGKCSECECMYWVEKTEDCDG